MTAAFVDLDVRPTLRAGGEPFQEIMQTVSTLSPGQGLRLFATFKPVPLFGVLGSRGFSHGAREIEGGDRVFFQPTENAAATDLALATPAADSTDWPDPVQELDTRELNPPEPMGRILAAIEAMQEDEVLSALLVREPIFLIPELAKRGHAWCGGFGSDGKTYKILVCVGAAREAAARAETLASPGETNVACRPLLRSA